MINNATYDNRTWHDLGINDKVKLSLASSLIISSVIMGFLSFILLHEVPTSVIGTMGLFGSEALAILGISSYFHNELVRFQSTVNEKLQDLEKNTDRENDIS